MRRPPARRRGNPGRRRCSTTTTPGKGDITGSTAAPEKPSGPPLKTSDKPPDPPKLEVAGAEYPLEPGKIASPGERAVLERLQERRQELDNRTRDLEMRENLLKAAEKRVEAKVGELKDVELRVGYRDGQSRQGRGGPFQEHRHHV